MEELKELHGEGGSDVFTSTRHVNPNAVSTKVTILSDRLF